MSSGAAAGAEPIRIAAIVPTLNAAPQIGACLAALQGGIAEVVVVDGGSRDQTVAAARAAGARVITAPAGRGSQLAAGAMAASAPWLLFLHADTILGPGWQAEAQRFAADPLNQRRAAYFRLVFDDPAPVARRLEAIVRWRARRFGLPYGDQGLLIQRDFYDRVGGFRPLPLMEDVDLVRRIGRPRLRALDAEALTSADRYRRDGWLSRSGRNAGLLMLYFLGVPPAVLRRYYASRRSA